MHHNIEIAAGVMGQPKPCPFGSGLRKFALEFVVKKIQVVVWLYIWLDFIL